MKVKSIASLLASVAARTVAEIAVSENYYCEETIFTIEETSG